MNSATTTATGALAQAYAALRKDTVWHQHEAQAQILNSLEMLLEGMEGTDLLTSFQAYIDEQRRELHIYQEAAA